MPLVRRPNGGRSERNHGWCIMPSHVHMIIGSNKKLEDIVRDMKSYTSTALRKAIKENVHERRKEWMIWMMERANFI